MRRLYDALSTYQTEIGNYDKPYWMLSIEQRIWHGLEVRPKEGVSTFQSQLLDVDLLRGTYVKSKPLHNFRVILWNGLAHMIFAPFYFRFWREHMSETFAKLSLAHYFLCLIHVVLHVYGSSFQMFWYEHSMPILCTILLSIIHAHIVAPVTQKAKVPSSYVSSCRRATESESQPNLVVTARKESEIRNRNRNQPSDTFMNRNNGQRPQIQFSLPDSDETSTIHRSVDRDDQIQITSGSWDMNMEQTLINTPPYKKTQSSSRDVDLLSGSVDKPKQIVHRNDSKASSVRACTPSGEDIFPKDFSITKKQEEEGLQAFISAKDKEIPEPVNFLKSLSHQEVNGQGKSSDKVLTISTLHDSVGKKTFKRHKKSSTSCSDNRAMLIDGHNEDNERVVHTNDDHVTESATTVSQTGKELDSLMDDVSMRSNENSQDMIMMSIHSYTSVPLQSMKTTSPGILSSPLEIKDFNALSQGENLGSRRTDRKFKQETEHVKRSSEEGNNRPHENEVHAEARQQQHQHAQSSQWNGSSARDSRGKKHTSLSMNANSADSVDMVTSEEKSASKELHNSGNSIKIGSSRRIRVSTVPLSDEVTENQGITNSPLSGSPTDGSHFLKNLQEIEMNFRKRIDDMNNEDTFTYHNRRKEQFEKLFRERSEARHRGFSSVDLSSDHACSSDSVGDSDADKNVIASKSTSNTQEKLLTKQGTLDTGSSEPVPSRCTAVFKKPVMNSVEVVETEKPEDDALADSEMKKDSFQNYTSETDWERINSDLCSEVSTSADEGDQKNEESPTNLQDPVDPFVLWYKEKMTSLHHVDDIRSMALRETVSCLYWENDVLKKSDLTLLDIGWSIIQRVKTEREDSTYLRLALWFSIAIACLPIVYQFYWNKLQFNTFLCLLLNHDVKWNKIRPCLIFLLDVVLRLFCFILLGFLLTVNEKTYQKRLQYAKHFCNLTSSHRSRKYHLPHFRLNKVHNVKVWLSLRTFMKKRGPQRSVECITTYAFYLFFIMVSLLCFKRLRNDYPMSKCLLYWELAGLSIFLSVFIVRFISLSMKISKKYRNLSILMTEQINVYLAIERKPHKRADLQLTYNMLDRVDKLLKEVDGPFRVCGYRINPLVYNILKVVILSACSAILSDYCQFKLKLYKIKLNPANW